MFIGVIVDIFFFKNHFIWCRNDPSSALSAPSFSFALCTENMHMNFNFALSSLSHQGEKIVEEDLLRIPLCPPRLNGNFAAGFLKSKLQLSGCAGVCCCLNLQSNTMQELGQAILNSQLMYPSVKAVWKLCWRRAWFFDMPSICTTEDYMVLIFRAATSVTLFSVVLRTCNRHGDLSLSLDFCSEIP